MCSAELMISGPKIIKLFSSSTHLSIQFIMFINVKMATIVGILALISKKNTTHEMLKAGNFIIKLVF